MDAEGAETLPGLGDDDFPGFPADVSPPELPNLSRHHSALADVLKEDPSMYGRLCGKETSSGVGLARCIKVGIDNRGHKMVKGIGVVAGDEECFDVFRDLFDQVIQRQHSDVAVVGICESHPTDLGRHGSRLTTECADPTGKYVLSSHVRASRNLSGFRFPPAMSRAERHEVERVLSQALIGACGAAPGDAYLPLRGSDSYVPRPGGMSAEEEAALQDAGLLFEAPDSTWRLCTGSGRHWPDGRGVFSTGDRATSAWVNEMEHLRVTSVEQGCAIQLAFRNVVQTLDAVADELHRRGLVLGRQAYAYSSRLGFLTSNLANLGTAMHVGMTLRLPRLAQHQSSHWREWCSVQRIQVRSTSIQNDGGQLPAVFELFNSDRLGISEVDTVNQLSHVVVKLVQMEQRLELGLPVDDLLASVQFPTVPHALPCPQAAALAGSAEAGQKARSALLLGLVQGGLPAAMFAVNGRGGVSGEGVARDGQSSTAEQFIEDVLHFAVQDHAMSVSSRPPSIYMAEEVMSDSGCEDSRPLSSQSMATIFAASDVSVNAAAAAEIVDTLLTEEIDARVKAVELVASAADGRKQAAPATTTPSKAQILETKQKVSAMLRSSCQSGELARVLRSVDQPVAGTQATEDEAGGALSALKWEMAAVLEKALVSGELEAALEQSSAEQSEEKARAEEFVGLKKATFEILSGAEQSGQLAFILASIRGEAHLNAAQQAEPQELMPATTIVEPSLPVAGGPRTTKPSVRLALRLLSGHDQRLGELAGKIRFMEHRVAERSEQCQQLEGMLAASKAEAAHLELDIEWHRQALQAAEERNAELNLSHRKLMGSLDLHHHSKSLDGGPSTMSARSEMSTTTGFTVASAGMSTCSWTPRMGHAVLEPITQR